MFTEERTRELQDQSVGTQLTRTEIALLKQFSYPWRPEQRTHTRNQAEIDNRFCSTGSQEGDTYRTSGVLKNILLKHLRNRLQIYTWIKSQVLSAKRYWKCKGKTSSNTQITDWNADIANDDVWYCTFFLEIASRRLKFLLQQKKNEEKKNQVMEWESDIFS